MINIAISAAILVAAVFGLWLQDANMKQLQAEIASLRSTTTALQATTEEAAAATEEVDSALDLVRTQLADALRPKTPAKK